MLFPILFLSIKFKILNFFLDRLTNCIKEFWIKNCNWNFVRPKLCTWGLGNKWKIGTGYFEVNLRLLWKLGCYKRYCLQRWRWVKWNINRSRLTNDLIIKSSLFRVDISRVGRDNSQSIKFHAIIVNPRSPEHVVVESSEAWKRSE